MKTNLVFLIYQLNSGGAQRQLITLARELNKNQFNVTIATYYPGGLFWEEAEAIPGVRIVCLQYTPRWGGISLICKLFALAREVDAHILHAYLPLANTFAFIVAKLKGSKVVWGIRISHRNLREYPLRKQVIFAIEAALSRFVDLIIGNSEASREFLTENGYDTTRMIVVPNGIDTNRFTRVPNLSFRESLGIKKNARMIGMVARIGLEKNHILLLEAISLLNEEFPIKIIFVGAGSVKLINEIKTFIREKQLAEDVIWLGEQRDVAKIYSVLDLLVSCSEDEGFSNTLAEAMACGTLCVATDVGDSKKIVGPFGFVVPPGSATSLASAIHSALKLSEPERLKIVQSARKHIEETYTVEKLAQTTALVLQGLVDH